MHFFTKVVSDSLPKVFAKTLTNKQLGLSVGGGRIEGAGKLWECWSGGLWPAKSCEIAVVLS